MCFMLFQETQETLAHKLYDKKIAPLGEKSFLQPSEGIKKVQAGMFGFQVIIVTFFVHAFTELGIN